MYYGVILITSCLLFSEVSRVGEIWVEEMWGEIWGVMKKKYLRWYVLRI